MEQVPDPLHSFKVAPTYSEKPKFNPDQPSFTLGWRNGGMEGRSVSDFESLCGCEVKLFAESCLEKLSISEVRSLFLLEKVINDDDCFLA